MILKINGVNILPLIDYNGGIKWQRSDLDDPESGRTLDGMMQRGRVATKIRLDIKCHPLKASDVQTLLNLILPEYVTVEYTDPMYGLRECTMYSNNNPATFLLLQKDGTEWWSEISFPLIER